MRSQIASAKPRSHSLFIRRSLICSRGSGFARRYETQLAKPSIHHTGLQRSQYFKNSSAYLISTRASACSMSSQELLLFPGPLNLWALGEISMPSR